MACAGKFVSAMVMVSLVISMVVVPPAAALNPILTCMTVVCPAQCKFNPFCLIPCLLSCRHFQLPPSAASQWQQLQQRPVRTPIPIPSSCLEGCVLSNCLDFHTNAFHLNQGEAMRSYKGCVNGCDVSCNNDDLH